MWRARRVAESLSSDSGEFIECRENGDRVTGGAKERIPSLVDAANDTLPPLEMVLGMIPE